MTSINPINVNTQGIASSYGYAANAKSEDKKAETKAETNQPAQKSQVAADDVFSYMAQTAASVTPTNAAAIDTSKYVDKESAQRIAGFVSQFEDIVATNLTAINQEFPNMSDGAKQSLALAQVNA